VAYAENFREGAKFHHNRVTSHINFRGSAEDTTILGGSGGMPPGKFCKITPKNTHLCAFWKQVLDNVVLHFFIFRVWGGGHGTVASPLRTLVCLSIWPRGLLPTFCVTDMLFTLICRIPSLLSSSGPSECAGCTKLGLPLLICVLWGGPHF